jgi:hypothetical protein
MVADSIHQAPSTFSFGVWAFGVRARWLPLNGDDTDTAYATHGLVSLLAGARDDKKKGKTMELRLLAGHLEGGLRCTVDSTPLPRFLPYAPNPVHLLHCSTTPWYTPPAAASTPAVQSILFLLQVAGKVALLFLDGLVIFISLTSQNWGWGFSLIVTAVSHR